MSTAIKLPCLLIFFLIIGTLSSTLHAAKLIVTQNLKVHTKSTLDSPVSRLLVKGSEVEVLKIEGEMTQFQDEKKNIGWVSSEFLILKSKNSVKEKSNEKKDSSLTKSPVLKNKLAPSKKTIPVTISINNKQPAKKVTSQTINNAKVNSVEANFIEPKLDRILNILEEKQEYKNEYRNYTETKNISEQLISISKKSYVLISVSLIIGFILGFLWHDYRLKRRHGGYKV